MPARERAIGPEVSERVNAAIRTARKESGLSMAALAARMAQEGFPMSAATIYGIEKGVLVYENGVRRTRIRLLSVDELTAFAQVLGVSPMDLLEEKEQ